MVAPALRLLVNCPGGCAEAAARGWAVNYNGWAGQGRVARPDNRIGPGGKDTIKDKQSQIAEGPSAAEEHPTVQATLPWSPGACPPAVFRSAICDCLSLNVSFSRLGRRQLMHMHFSLGRCVCTCVCI